MRYGVIADVHANLAAFEAVVKQLSGLDEIWFLGDVVGYGPSPNECVDLLASIDAKCILGNHDAAAVGKLDLASFNVEARRALEWTSNKLTPESKEFLNKLPLEETLLGEVTLVHGSPREPVWEYIYTSSLADANFSHFEGNICFIGHTHLPLIFIKSGEAPCQMFGFGKEEEISLKKSLRYIINSGSIGQPRDSNPKASYLIFDSEEYSLEYHRLEYPVAGTQEKMRKEGLPGFLIERLAHGI